METKQTIFQAASFLLPAYAPADARFTKWAAIACDQFTSEPEYWAEAEKLASGADSTLHLFLPEAYLGTPGESAHRAAVGAEMTTVRSKLTSYTGFVALSRTLPDGRVRRGIVGKMDLEAYDYAADSRSPIRATEATVVERIPPRQAIRAEATVELPHIMILVSDPCGTLMNTAFAAAENGRLLYDFDLMLGGGHAAGRLLEGAGAEALTVALASYETARAGQVVYAMGDGNHSLAAAKAHWEAVKKTLPAGRTDIHPARYALCEIVALEDPALDFEPIHRVMLHVDREDFLETVRRVSAPGAGEQTVTLVSGAAREVRHFTVADHALTVGTLQNLIDRYLASHSGAKCDYIHDEDSLVRLSAADGAVGILLDGMKKEDLFPYVTAHGTLPRKTFSMGEARSKRYYLEARAIVE